MAITALAPTGVSAKMYTVVINSMVFGAAPAGLRVGDSIRWINRDIFRHTVTASDKRFDIDLAPNQQATTLLRNAGPLRYACRYHPGMVGRLDVLNKR